VKPLPHGDRMTVLGYLLLMEPGDLLCFGERPLYVLSVMYHQAHMITGGSLRFFMWSAFGLIDRPCIEMIN
jgi:hypothetical protein